MLRVTCFKSHSRLCLFCLTPCLVLALTCSVAQSQVIQDDHVGKIIDHPEAAKAVDQKPTQTESVATGYDPSRVIFALAGVIGLILVLRHAGKKLFPATAATSRSVVVKVLSRTALAPRQQVLLLQVGKRILVVGDSNSQLNCLCQIDETDEVAQLLGELRRPSVTSIANPFSAIFGRAKKDFDDPNEVEEEILLSDRAGEMDEIAPENQLIIPGVVALTSGDSTDAQWTDPAVSETRSEISNLTDRIRNLKRQLSTEASEA